MARDGGNQVLRRGRDIRRRSSHLHQNEVAQAWGEYLTSRHKVFFHTPPVEAHSIYILLDRMGGFRRDVRTHVWCAFGVLTLIRPITPDAGARWNP